MDPLNSETSPVIMRRHAAGMSIILNRKEVLNSLNLEMVRSITSHLNEALADDDCKLVLFYSAGGRGFCAGGDMKRIYQDIRNNNMTDVNRFFLEEFSLDLMIHRFPKPVIVIADGLTMGGGLGIAEGADWVIATERTRMAMPETRIGFYPDVGATGWLFSKCPPGYPEYLGLTSYEMTGGECVRLGLATHLTRSDKVPDLIRHHGGIQGKGHLPSEGTAVPVDEEGEYLFRQEHRAESGGGSVGGKLFCGEIIRSGGHRFSSGLRTAAGSLRGHFFGPFGTIPHRAGPDLEAVAAQ